VSKFGHLDSPKNSQTKNAKRQKELIYIQRGDKKAWNRTYAKTERLRMNEKPLRKANSRKKIVHVVNFQTRVSSVVTVSSSRHRRKGNRSKRGGKIFVLFFPALFLSDNFGAKRKLIYLDQVYLDFRKRIRDIKTYRRCTSQLLSDPWLFFGTSFYFIFQRTIR
jgi:hypothetical protein